MTPRIGRITALASVLGLAACMGAGCSNNSAQQACNWIPQSEVERLVAVKISRTEQPAASSAGHACTYFNADGLPVFSVSDDAQSESQFVASIRNLFPTDKQPDISEHLGVGDDSAIVHYGRGISILFVHHGVKGYILSNVSNQTLQQAGLVELAKVLISSVK